MSRYRCDDFVDKVIRLGATPVAVAYWSYRYQEWLALHGATPAEAAIIVGWRKSQNALVDRLNGLSGAEALRLTKRARELIGSGKIADYGDALLAEAGRAGLVWNAALSAFTEPAS